MTPKDILNKHTCNGQISTNFGIIQAMEEYAAQQTQEVKEERDSAISDRAEVMDLLDECRLQLEYLDNRFPTGTTANILNRLEIFLDKKQQP